MNELHPHAMHLRYSESGSILRVFTGFLWGSGKGALHRPAVGVVTSADAAFVLDLGRANLSIAANFLKTRKTTEGGRVSFDATVRRIFNRSIRVSRTQMCQGSF